MTDATPTDAIDRFLVRETLERYLGSLDDKDWDGIAGCFTDDAMSYYNDEPDALRGGTGVATWLHRMKAYDATNHALGNARITVDGDRATAHSLVVATLHQGTEGVGRVQVRAIDYRDQLIRTADGWRIQKRVHRPTLQYDALSQTKILYRG
ncbi:nuclear transport factor 2 family protein [Streptomyces sp. ISL-12]|uniref:nuclear transport factor 2 family protein n=1 Tax=Streptomyces sp. ISL-12 TaxID=2819177 RepID=UPI001BE943F8|nr:nuclear transport factor 2 family protein [Streptomyces sp. ISL-12]MBT2412481.1 nuclear transport factor 2 family protein [Streptomyces sp. ISL-12]